MVTAHLIFLPLRFSPLEISVLKLTSIYFLNYCTATLVKAALVLALPSAFSTKENDR